MTEYQRPPEPHLDEVRVAYSEAEVGRRSEFRLESGENVGEEMMPLEW